MLLPSKESVTRNLPSEEIRDGKPKETVTRNLGSDDSEGSESFEHNLTRNLPSDSFPTSERTQHNAARPIADSLGSIPPPLGGGVRLPSEAGSGTSSLPNQLLPSDDLSEAVALRGRYLAGIDWLRSHCGSANYDDGVTRITQVAMEYAGVIDELKVTIGDDLPALHDDLIERLERGYSSEHPEAGERFAERLRQYEVVHDALGPAIFGTMLDRVNAICRN